jgi:hypothetical protein
MADRVSDRGFVGFGETHVTCTYGAEVDVYESSAASGPHVWLSVVDFPRTADPEESRERAAAHLDVAQAREVRDRINAWLRKHDYVVHENMQDCSHDVYNGCAACDFGTYLTIRQARSETETSDG